jgi:hypothetical protein
MQSIFRPASRREALGEHAGGARRDGGLKMGWAKPSGCGDIYGYRLPTQSLRGSEAARGDERVGRSGWVALPPVSCHGVGGMRSAPEKIFAMNRVATPLLSLGSSQACPE